MDIKKLLISTALAAAVTPLAMADIAVVVHKSNPISEMSTQEVRQYFLGKRNTFSNGNTAKPLDQAASSALHEAFTKKVLKKTPSSLNSYWSRQMFSGKGNPPDAVEGGDKSVISMLQEYKSGIAYIDAANLDDSVKPVLIIKQ